MAAKAEHSGRLLRVVSTSPSWRRHCDEGGKGCTLVPSLGHLIRERWGHHADPFGSQHTPSPAARPQSKLLQNEPLQNSSAPGRGPALVPERPRGMAGRRMGWRGQQAHPRRDAQRDPTRWPAGPAPQPHTPDLPPGLCGGRRGSLVGDRGWVGGGMRTLWR